MYSPTITVGISIENDTSTHFHYDPGSSIGVLPSLQMVKRNRNAKNFKIYLQKNYKYYPTNIEKIIDTLDDFHIEDDYGDYVHWSSDQAKQENMDDLFAFFERVGWKLLRNENHIFQSDSGKLALLGVENWGANPRFPKLGDIDKALKGAEDADVKVLMTHDPTHWDKVIIPEKYYQVMAIVFAEVYQMSGKEQEVS